MGKKTDALVGKRFGKLVVLRVADPVRRPNGTIAQMLECKCDCGNHTTVSYSHLVYGGVHSCGCIKHEKRYEDLTGMVFGRLHVDSHIGRVKIGKDGQYSQLWNCTCSCGNTLTVNSRDFRSGNTASCGCKQGEANRLNNLNKYDLSGEYGIGYCSDGAEFYFDIEDYPIIKDYTWYCNDSGYLITTYKKKRFRMHRLICGFPDDTMDVDHINHNTRDNRRCNLRVCTHQENSFNKLTPSNNSSGHVGVSFSMLDKQYRAYIQKDGKYWEIGMFDNYEDAVIARETAEKEWFGKYAIER